MTHKLYYAITPQRKLAYYDALLYLGKEANIDKAIYENLMNLSLRSIGEINEGLKILPDGREFPISYELIESVKIPKTKAEYKGEKGVFICYESQQQNLLLALKISNYVFVQLGIQPASFDQFINSVVNGYITTTIQQAAEKKMNDERTRGLQETTKEVKPKK